MQSLKVRYRGREEEIKEGIKTHGLINTMGMVGAKDFIAFERFAQELMPDGEDIPYTTEVSRHSLEELCQIIVDKMADKISWQTNRIIELETELQQYRGIANAQKQQSKIVAARLMTAVAGG